MRPSRWRCRRDGPANIRGRRPPRRSADVDRGIEQPAELLEMKAAARRTRRRSRIVGIIEGAAEDPRRLGALGGEMDDARLPLGRSATSPRMSSNNRARSRCRRRRGSSSLAASGACQSLPGWRWSSNGLRPAPSLRRRPGKPRRTRPALCASAGSARASAGATEGVDAQQARRDRNGSRGGRPPPRAGPPSSTAAEKPSIRPSSGVMASPPAARRVDGGVDRCLDLAARRAGRDRLAEAEGDDPRPLDEAGGAARGGRCPPRPAPPAAGAR